MAQSDIVRPTQVSELEYEGKPYTKKILYGHFNEGMTQEQAKQLFEGLVDERDALKLVVIEARAKVNAIYTEKGL